MFRSGYPGTDCRLGSATLKSCYPTEVWCDRPHSKDGFPPLFLSTIVNVWWVVPGLWYDLRNQRNRGIENYGGDGCGRSLDIKRDYFRLSSLHWTRSIVSIVLLLPSTNSPNRLKLKTQLDKDYDERSFLQPSRSFSHLLPSSTTVSVLPYIPASDN